MAQIAAFIGKEAVKLIAWAAVAQALKAAAKAAEARSKTK